MDRWVITGARVALNARTAARLDIEVRNGRVHALNPPHEGKHRARILDLSGYLVLPGLINAHDHLEFNLFPRLGKGPYPSASAWARDIYHPGQSPIREHLKVPLKTRLVWGGIKNLLNGVTTVCHHNPYEARVFERNFPVRVLEQFGWAHSLEFSPDLAARFRQSPQEWPFIVHLAESTDQEGSLEIFQLEALGALGQRTVIVHGVGLSYSGLRLIRRAGAALIWCPSSNRHILGRSVPASVFRMKLPVALGTDSAMSGKGFLLDELGVARTCAPLQAARLYDMVTCDAARVLRLKNGEGAIGEGAIADLVAVRDRGRSPASTLLALSASDIDMVLLGGKIKLLTAKLLSRVEPRLARGLNSLGIEEEPPVYVAANVQKHYADAAEALGPRLLLAGKKLRLV